MIIQNLKFLQFSSQHSFIVKDVLLTTPKACPCDDEEKEQISGTKLREMIQNGQSPSKYILRPEVAKVILDHPKPFVD